MLVRKLLIAAAAALLLTGGATAAVAVKRIMLHPGACVVVSKTRVCAPKVKARTIVRHVTETLPAATVTAPAATVTSPPVTVTVSAPAPAPAPAPVPTPAPPTGGGSRVTLHFTGNGDLTLAPFTLPVGETLTWTWQNTNGDFPTGMSIHDDANFEFLVDADGTVTSGSTYIGPGSHTLSTITIGNWTIDIG